MAQQIQLRRDTATNWTSNNPVLAVGEIGIELNEPSSADRLKIGDGTRAWNDLPYLNTGGGGGGIPDAPNANNHVRRLGSWAASDALYAALDHTHVEADITDLDKYTQAEIDTRFDGRAIAVVTALPGTPDANTIYFVTG